MEKVRLTFHGGVGSVTGANFLLEAGKTKMLIDCGLIQGFFKGKDPNYEPFPYKPSEIDYLLVTHAHTDHIGRIPKLVKDGFKGKIFSTPVTREVAGLMLHDGASVQLMKAKEKKIPALYDAKDVDKALGLWGDIEYHTKTKIGDEFEVYFKDAGHILGSAMIEVVHISSGKKVVFTGDLGNSPTPLLRDTEVVDDADYLVMESVYGDRNHEEVSERREHLAQAINKVMKRGGTLIIPVFSLEKTQVLLHEMNDLLAEGKIPQVPVFLDSPLAINVTDIYQKQFAYFNEHIKKEISRGDDVFDFPKLKETLRRNDSATIHKAQAPKIIIAASGMSVGGRITEHEKRYLPDSKNALLLIGYQVLGSLGRAIQDGKKEVMIEGQKIQINADVLKVSGYSSHKDSDNLLEFVSHTAEKVKKVFVVMGEPKSALFLAQKLHDNLDVDAVHPAEGESVVLG